MTERCEFVWKGRAADMCSLVTLELPLFVSLSLSFSSANPHESAAWPGLTPLLPHTLLLRDRHISLAYWLLILSSLYRLSSSDSLSYKHTHTHTSAEVPADVPFIAICCDKSESSQKGFLVLGFLNKSKWFLIAAVVLWDTDTWLITARCW